VAQRHADGGLHRGRREGRAQRDHRPANPRRGQGQGVLQEHHHRRIAGQEVRVAGTLRVLRLATAHGVCLLLFPPFSSRTFTVLSAPPEAISVPSVFTLTLRTASVWPFSTSVCLPVDVPQTRMVLSAPALASFLPSPLKVSA